MGFHNSPGCGSPYPPPPMKLKTPHLAALLAIVPVLGDAFTLDAAGYNGADLPQDPASIQITGYGEVIFEAPEGMPIMVNSGYMHDTLPPSPDRDFDQANAVRIVLNDHESSEAGLIFAGIPAADEQPAPLSKQHDFNVASTEAKVANPNRIPETASAVLGLLGAALLLLRRLR